MRLETKNKSVNLVLRTKKIITLKNLLKEKSFEIGFTKGYTENDPEVLSKIIFVLSEDDEGQKVFNSSEDVLDFLDDLRIENKESFQDIYGKIAEALNDEGFFKKKMTKEELAEMSSNPLNNVDMDLLIKESVKNSITNIAEEQFKGYQA
jgi:hypothetical protein